MAATKVALSAATGRRDFADFCRLPREREGGRGQKVSHLKPTVEIRREGGGTGRGKWRRQKSRFLRGPAGGISTISAGCRRERDVRERSKGQSSETNC